MTHSMHQRMALLLEVVLVISVTVLGVKFGELLVLFLDQGYKGSLNDLRAGVRTREAIHLLSSLWILRLLLATGLALALGRLTKSRRLWVWALAPLLCVAIAQATRAATTHDPARAYRWLVEAVGELWSTTALLISVSRADILFVAGFVAALSVVIFAVPVRHLQKLRVALWCLLVAMLLLAGLELLGYVKIGMNSTGRSLLFALTNARSLFPVIRGELDLAGVTALLGPVAIGMALLLVFRRKFGAQLPTYRPRQIVVGSSIGAALLTFLVWDSAPPSDHRYDRLAGNIYAGLADLIPSHGANELKAVKIANGLPAFANTAAASLTMAGGGEGLRRNVILILLESARAASTSIYDQRLDSTPFLSEFARRGAVVSNMYAVMPRTSAAWVTVLHGTWPSPDDELTRWSREDQLSLKSLPTLLSTIGYSSAFFTSSHLKFGYDEPLIRNMGFSTVESADTLTHGDFEQTTYWGFEDRMMLKPSLEWARGQQQQGKPFFLTLMSSTSHFDYRYPASWTPRNFNTGNANYDRYLNCLAYTDSWLKDFISGLDEMGVLSSSIVVILGDHGESFGEHGAEARSLLVYDETLRIPTILYARDLVSPNSVISGLRQQIDIEPTILDMLDVRISGTDLPGTSLLKDVADDRPLYFGATLDSYAMAIRRKNLKFVYNFGRRKTEVYDLKRDPAESNDIASTMPKNQIEKAETDLLVWHERALRQYLPRGVIQSAGLR